MAFLLLLHSLEGFTQDLTDADEVSITLQVQNLGSTEVVALISGQTVHLPITDVFNFLRIRNIPSETVDSISGFFIHPNALFLVDGTNRKIEFGGKSFSLSPSDIIKTETNLYLRSDYFASVFGLVCNFNFRSLSITLTSTVELPVMRDIRLEQMRANIGKLKGIRKSDTVLATSNRRFHFGMFDWSVITGLQGKKLAPTRIALSSGGTIAGGETSISYNYTNKVPLSTRQLFYRWRLVDNERPIVKQFTAGKFYAQSISTINVPLNGIQLTNIPTTSRKSFGSYRLSRKTEPGWTVELYVNNILVNAVKADASGFYSFDVPLIYGNSSITLHFYGPWGEERTEEENLLVPFQFVPVKQLQYNFASGFAEDGKNSAFARLHAMYGVSHFMTVSAGWEHLSSIVSGTNIPFLNAAIRIGSRTLVSSEWALGVRTKTVMTYSLPSNMQVELNYVKYEREQSAVRFNYLEERRLAFSSPVKIGNLNSFTRFSLNQYVLPKQQYTSGEVLISAVFHGVSANLTNNAMYYGSGKPYIFSNISLSLATRKGYRFTPRLQYEYREKRISLIKAEMDKNIFRKGYLNIAAEANYRSQINSVAVGFRYDLNFAQATTSAKYANGMFTLNQSAKGSVIYDKKAGVLIKNSLTNVGRAVVVVTPFLDFNANGKRDLNEEKVTGLQLHINGRSIQRSQHDTSIYITGLEAYIKYLIELEPASFQTISWQLKKRAIEVFVKPNEVTLVEVPVYVYGEVAGTVSLKNDNGLDGQSGMIVCIYNTEGLMVARLITEADGYFNYLGLAAGQYVAKIDVNQLKKLGLLSSPEIPFTIKRSKEGDIVDGLEFTLTKELSPEK